MTRSDQESPVPETGTPGLKRRGLETGLTVPRQSSTLLKTAKALGGHRYDDEKPSADRPMAAAGRAAFGAA